VTNKLSNGALDGSGRVGKRFPWHGLFGLTWRKLSRSLGGSASRRTGRPRMAEGKPPLAPFLLQRDVKAVQPAA